LEEFSSRHPRLPGSTEQIDVLILLRRLQILMWVLESREHPAFREEWRQWARLDLDTVAAALGR